MIDSKTHEKVIDGSRSKFNKENPHMKPEKTVFNNNTSTMRKHCSCKAKTHFKVYRDGCAKLNIKMHNQAIPTTVKGNVGACIYFYFEPQAPNLSLIRSGMKQLSMDDLASTKSMVWTKEGLQDKIVDFVLTTNQVSVNIILVLSHN